jgi:hypothetical protein
MAHQLADRDDVGAGAEGADREGVEMGVGRNHLCLDALGSDKQRSAPAAAPSREEAPKPWRWGERSSILQFSVIYAKLAKCKN